MQQADPFVDALQKWIELSMHRSVRHFIGCARERGLSIPQLGALFLIHRRRGSGVTDLGDDLGVTSSAASQMLERLVQQELVVRLEDPSDRRVKQIALTAKGFQVVEESMHTRQRWVSDLARNLSEAEKRDILPALNLLLARAVQLRQPAEAGK